MVNLQKSEAEKSMGPVSVLCHKKPLACYTGE